MNDCSNGGEEERGSGDGIPPEITPLQDLPPIVSIHLVLKQLNREIAANFPERSIPSVPTPGQAWSPPPPATEVPQLFVEQYARFQDLNFFAKFLSWHGRNLLIDTPLPEGISARLDVLGAAIEPKETSISNDRSTPTYFQNVLGQIREELGGKVDDEGYLIKLEKLAGSCAAHGVDYFPIRRQYDGPNFVYSAHEYLYRIGNTIVGDRNEPNPMRFFHFPIGDASLARAKSAVIPLDLNQGCHL